MPSLSSLTISWPDATEVSIFSDRDTSLEPEGILGRLGVASISGVYEAQGGSNDQISCLAFVADPEGLLQPIRVLEETSYQLVVNLPYPKAFCVEQRMRSRTKTWPFINPQIQRTIEVAVPRLWTEDQAKSCTQIPAFFNARSQVGRIDLSLDDSQHRLSIEVMTAKITYEDEFKQLIEEIAEAHLQLAYEIGASSGLSFKSSVLNAEDLPSLLFHIRRLMSFSELPAAIERILSAPFDAMITQDASFHRMPTTVPNASLFSKQVRNIQFQPGGTLARLFRGMSPEVIPGVRRVQTFDIPENRYVKHFLLTLENLLARLESACRDEKKLVALEDVSRWLELVRDWLAHSLWREVGDLTSFPSNSQRLQRSVGYQDVLAADIIIKQSLALPWTDSSAGEDIIVGDVKAVSELYEYWCFFTMRGILQDLFGPDQLSGKGLTVTSPRGLSVRLAAMNDGRGCIFTLPHDRGELHLFYSRQFRPKGSAQWGEWSGTYSIDFDPDISIAIDVKGRGTHWLNFDAKYKLQRFMWNDAEGLGPAARTPQKEYKQEDLNKMHCYRDAILGTRGSYILYPGSTDIKDVYVRRSAVPRKGEGVPGVGAFALRPGNENQRAVLFQFVADFVNRVTSATGYQEETGLF
jgi:predicted component of viral defense system (DUF524 family)